jgi:uncharacterized membrane protein YdjX (TVP38/TMEM64 family)
MSFGVKAALLAILVLLLFVSQFFLDISAYFSPEMIKGWLRAWGALAPVFYMLVMALAIVASPIPSLPLNIAAGAVFGPLAGTAYSLFGALAGALASFMIARLLGRELMERFLGGHVNFCTRCSDRLLTKIVFVSRLLPFVSFDVVSYGAGLTRMSPGRFGLATFTGMVPLTFLYNYTGSVLVFGRGIALVFGLLLVLAFFLMPRWLEKKGLLSRFGMSHATGDAGNGKMR